jgi:hypothetical protein
MSPPLRLPGRLLEETFGHFRRCGQGRRECQVLWVGPWSDSTRISRAVHSGHRAHAGGFDVDDGWLSDFWLKLAEEGLGVRVQVHTHPTHAFHSPTDDAFPVLQTPGFLSLVIPDFALGAIGFQAAYLTELQPDGGWREVSIPERLVLE